MTVLGRLFRGGTTTRLVAVLLAGALVAGAFAAATVLGVLTPSSAGADENRPPQGVLFVGVAELAWEDVSPENTPTLYGLIDDNAVASFSVRTVRSRTCMNDGWLTISAGRRAADATTIGCGRPPYIIPQYQEPWQVAGWEGLKDLQQDFGRDARLGLLGDRLAAAEVCSTAVGPGAATALADQHGEVRRYFTRVPDVTELTACPITLIDLGWLPSKERPTERRAAVQQVDEQIGAIIRELPADYPVLIAGVADSGPMAPRLDGEPTKLPPRGLRVALASGLQPGGESTYGPNWLTARSTRWTGVTQITDVTATLLAYAGLPNTAGLDGQPWVEDKAHPTTAEQTLAELVGSERAVQLFTKQSWWFFQLLGLIELLVFGLTLVAFRRRPDRGPRILRIVQGAALTFASFPVASFLANLSRWWLSSQPGLVLYGTIFALSILIAAIAALGPWRRRPYGPVGVVAAVTAITLGIDVLTGSNLQHLSLLGLSPVVAGRFYGFGNIPYAIFVAACLVLGAAVAQWMIDSGRSRNMAVAAAGTIGLFAILIDGHPSAGADVGGLLATIPAFAVLLFAVGRWRLSVGRIALVVAVTVAAFMGLAALDYLRPPADRTHFGDFVDSLLNGEAWTVLGRKYTAMVGTLSRSFYGWLVPIAFTLIVMVTRNPARFHAGHLLIAMRRWPLLKPLIWAGLTACVVGFIVNDSGIIVPALILTIGIPLVTAAVVHAARHELTGVSPEVKMPSAAAAPRD